MRSCLSTLAAARFAFHARLCFIYILFRKNVRRRWSFKIHRGFLDLFDTREITAFVTCAVGHEGGLFQAESRIQRQDNAGFPRNADTYTRVCMCVLVRAFFSLFVLFYFMSDLARYFWPEQQIFIRCINNLRRLSHAPRHR